MNLMCWPIELRGIPRPRQVPVQDSICLLASQRAAPFAADSPGARRPLGIRPEAREASRMDLPFRARRPSKGAARAAPGPSDHMPSRIHNREIRATLAGVSGQEEPGLEGARPDATGFESPGARARGTLSRYLSPADAAPVGTIRRRTGPTTSNEPITTTMAPWPSARARAAAIV